MSALFAVPTFSYAGSSLVETVDRVGHATVNIGDFMQTLAVRRVLGEVGVKPDDIIELDRDGLRTYAGPPVNLIMNGCFPARSFPIADSIRPIFIGFQAKPEVLRDQRDYLARFGSIGCRDVATADACRELGIEAHVTGCLSLTIRSDARRPTSPGKVFIVVGEGAGALPAEALAAMPHDLSTRAEFIYHRLVVHNIPLDSNQLANAERYAAHLLDRFRRQADLVITPLHHVAAPCLGLGVPVVLCRTQDDPRFSYLRSLLPVHVRPDFSDIDWKGATVAIEPIRQALVDRVRSAVAMAA